MGLLPWATERQRFGHARHHVWLRDRLALADGLSAVVVCTFGLTGWQEGLTSHDPHRFQYGLVLDASARQLLANHARPRGGEPPGVCAGTTVRRHRTAGRTTRPGPPMALGRSRSLRGSGLPSPPPSAQAKERRSVPRWLLVQESAPSWVPVWSRQSARGSPWRSARGLPLRSAPRWPWPWLRRQESLMRWGWRRDSALTSRQALPRR